MRTHSRLVPLAFAVLVLATARDAAAQRGRGPSEEIMKRSGSYVVDVQLPDAVPTPKNRKRKQSIPLEQTSFVTKNAQAGHLTLLYLYDGRSAEKDRGAFERTIFGHAELRTMFRAFVCGRADIGADDAARDEFGEVAPLFVAFDANAKLIGRVEMPGFKATASPLTKLLEKTARKHAKMSLTKFVKAYRKWLNDYQVWEGRVRTLRQKRDRLLKKVPRNERKLDEVDDEEVDLEKAKEKMLEDEEKLLAKASIPPRPEGAVRLGDRRRGRR